MPEIKPKLGRFLSDPTYRKYGYVDEEIKDKKKILESTNKTHQEGKINFLRQISSKGEKTIDEVEQHAQLVGDMLAKPMFTRVASLSEDQSEDSAKPNNSIVISSVSPHAVIETGLNNHRTTKNGSQRFRWNLMFNLLVWIIVPFPFWMPFISNTASYFILPSVQVIAILALKNALILYKNRSRNFSKNGDGQEKICIRHIVAISCYKEPVELISKSVQTLADQTEVHRITMVISFEQRTPEKEEKCRILESKFRNSGFERIIFTIHPFGLPNEIPGKCSNANFGLRMAVEQMAINPNDTDNILVTTCDADSKFPPQYIAALTYKYLKENRPALSTIYQSPLLYNWKLDGLSFVTRVTGLLRSFLMLGALIPFNINTMSIFSFSLSLATRGNFVHPGYQMDDIICLIRWMGVTGERLKISMIPVPVLSGPTSGDTVEKEIIEWARQARRWTIGAAEVFHYFVIKAKRMPLKAAFSWGTCFIIYYGILLCTGGLFGLTSMLSMFLLVKDVPDIIGYIMYGLLGLQMLAFFVAFIIDGFIPKLLNVKENIFILRNLLHFITTPFVLLGYSLVEFYALHEIVVFGKKVCKHGASDKGSLEH